jgi:glycosyltransferase involved in cell wall biosynthesis
MRRAVVMVGSHPEDRGGIGSVMRLYLEQGLIAWDRFIPSYRTGSKALRATLFLQAFGRLGRLLWRHPEVRLVHLHMSERGSVLRKGILLELARQMGRATVLHLHGAELVASSRRSPPWVRALVRRTLSRADALVTLSQSEAREVDETFALSSVVIPNPVLCPPGWQPCARAAGPLRVLFLGRFGRRKGVFDLVSALGLLRSRGIEVQARMHGDGALEELQRALRAARLEPTARAGPWLSPKERALALRESDVLVLPSYEEGLPMAILEAMAHGLAVIATPVGGISEAVLPDLNGWLVPPGQPEALAEALQRLAGDRQTLARFQRAGQERASRLFAPEIIFGQLDHLWGSLLR